MPLTSIDGKVTAIADIVAQAPDGTLIVIEVKTGTNPTYTYSQRIVYTTVPYGGHVYSTSPKIRSFGFKPYELLPPSGFDEFYKKDDGTPASVIRHDPMR